MSSVNVPSEFLYQPSNAPVTLSPRSFAGSNGNCGELIGACAFAIGSRAAIRAATHAATVIDWLRCIRKSPFRELYLYNFGMLKQLGRVLFAIASLGAAVTVAGQAPSAPATYVGNADLMAALKKATAANPDMSTP